MRYEITYRDITQEAAQQVGH